MLYKRFLQASILECDNIHPNLFEITQGPYHAELELKPIRELS